MARQERNYGFWNWGTGIALVLILGAAALIFLVYKTTQVNFSMVEKDYYSAELQFDSKKAAQANTRSLSSPINIHHDSGFLIIRFPKECIGSNIQGGLVLYRPSDQRLDIEIPLQLDKDGMIIIEDSKLISGKYILKGNWQMNGKSYDVEQAFFVTK
ncbi:MAG: FixH family protein [Bacteroidia bacterium]|nr:FixH family protein [Bacteroidota bacterium]MCZ2130851.1 FixH family protein [Bacteroidia bacterium]